MEKTGLSLSAIAKILGSYVPIDLPEKRIKHLAIDTRTLLSAEESLFFALKDKRDGHDFIAAAYDAGVRSFVINTARKEEFLSAGLFSKAQFFPVENTFKALQQIAKAHRQQFNLPIIGITGSNGKTLVKEWLYQLLQGEKDYQIKRNPKSFNSQVGLALSLWELQAKDNLGIFEAGISEKDEMDALQDMMQPNIGILTNLGEAHNAGFASKAEKLTEKLKLFKQVHTFIYSPVYIPDNYTSALPGKHQFTWSLDSKEDLGLRADLDGADLDRANKPSLEVDLKIQVESKSDNHTQLKAVYKNEKVTCVVPFQDQASLENVATCWATLIVLDYSLSAAAERLQFLYPVHMRMALVNGLNHCSIIDDTYSADLSSLLIALDFLNQQKQHPKRTLILSDILESGLDQEVLYTQIAAMVKAKKVNRFIGIGPAISIYANLFDAESVFFDSVEELISNLGSLNFSNESILVKGARSFGLERLTAHLSAKAHDTVLEINLRALNDNLQAYRQKLKAGVKIMAMVKAFSYGSGSYEVANLLAFQKVDYLTVAYADEGQALRQAGIQLPIMVMSPEPSAFQMMWQSNLEPEIYSIELLQAYINFLKANAAVGSIQGDANPAATNQPAAIHIKLDTGMHRLGFEAAQLPQLIKVLTDHSYLQVKSVFTHLVGSDNAVHDSFTALQIKSYESMYSQLVEVLPNKPLRHVLNTSGISRFPDAQFDMVRLGIGLYALDSTFEPQEELQSVLVWKTTVSQVKKLEAGETVGYGRRGVIYQASQIATVKVGYADGYSRKFGNGVGKMMIKGKAVPTVGSVCMDMCMLDVTELEVTGIEVKPGDEVIIFDTPKAVQKMAEQLETIPYEVICGISQRVKRIYYYE